MIVTFKHLITGNIYTVEKSFSDADGKHIIKGSVLHYLKTEFMPYDAEYTIIFQENEICLNENINSEIINNLNEYLVNNEKNT